MLKTWARVCSQGFQELSELFDGQVEDRFILEDFFGFGFLDGEALASLATTGVLVRGFVINRFA
jgi:hypothetical protein